MTLAAIPPDVEPTPLAAYSDVNAILGVKPKHAGNGKNGHAAPEPTARLVESADAFIARYVPLDYVIDGFLIRGYLYGLTSMSNHGKTTVGTAIACHIATGEKFAGMEISSGRVLLMYGENSDNSRLQLIAAMQHFDLTGGNIDIVSRKFPLTEYIDQILAECQGEYAFVLVDSSAAYFSYSEENDNVQAHAHASDLRRLTKLPGSPTVMVLCHPTVAATKDNLRPRGGGAFENELDTSLRLWKTDTTTEMYAGNKVRGPVLEGLQFDLKAHTLQGIADKRGRPLTVPVSVPMGEQQAAAHHKQMMEADSKVLWAMLHHEGGSLSDWASACGWALSTGKPYKTKVGNILKRLLPDKLVVNNRNGWALTELGKKEAQRIL